MNKALKRRLTKGLVSMAVLSVAVGAFSLEGGQSAWRSVLPDSFKYLPDTYLRAKPSSPWTESAQWQVAAADPHGAALPHVPEGASWVQALDVSKVGEKHLPLLSGPSIAAGHYTLGGQWVPAGQGGLGMEQDLLASGRFGAPSAGMAGSRPDNGSFEGLQVASASGGSGASMGVVPERGDNWQSAFYGAGSGGMQMGQGSHGPAAYPTDMVSAPIQVAAVSPIPEPGTYALMLAGLLGLLFMRRRRSI